MKLQAGVVVDESKVLGHLRELEHQLEKGAVSWILSRFLTLAVAGTICTVVLPAVLFGEIRSIVDSSTPLFWVRWLLPTVCAAPSALFMYRGVRKRIKGGTAPISEGVLREWKRLTGPGWLRRTLLLGAGFTAVTGGTIGLLIATQWPLSDMPGGSRLLGFFGFVGLTALWVLPMMFGIRAFAIKKNGEFLRPDQTRRIGT